MVLKQKHLEGWAGGGIWVATMTAETTLALSKWEPEILNKLNVLDKPTELSSPKR